MIRTNIEANKYCTYMLIIPVTRTPTCLVISMQSKKTGIDPTKCKSKVSPVHNKRHDLNIFGSGSIVPNIFNFSTRYEMTQRNVFVYQMHCNTQFLT